MDKNSESLISLFDQW